jgi:DNA-binding Lrp family transcriptional regulator
VIFLFQKTSLKNDIIAKVNADSEDQINQIVARKVREIEGIKNTLTMIIL